MKAENSAKIQFDSLSANEALPGAQRRPFWLGMTHRAAAGRHQDGGVRSSDQLHRPRLPGCHRSRDPEHRRLPGAAGEDNSDG